MPLAAQEESFKHKLLSLAFSALYNLTKTKPEQSQLPLWAHVLLWQELLSGPPFVPITLPLLLSSLIPTMANVTPIDVCWAASFTQLFKVYISFKNQRRQTRMAKGLKLMPHKDQLKGFWIFGLKKRNHKRQGFCLYISEGSRCGRGVKFVLLGSREPSKRQI